MIRVYISGALTNVTNPNEIKSFYESIGDTCSQFGLQPYVPHLKTDPDENPHITPREIFLTDKQQVTSSDLLISYIGTPSLGVGMELAYAESANVPIILMYEQGRRVSRFPRGIPGIVAEICFASKQQALMQLQEALKQFILRKSSEELHIEVRTKPNELHQHVRIQDKNNRLIMEKERIGANGRELTQLLTELDNKGVTPKKVYIDPFSDIKAAIQSVWAEAEVLYEYRQ